MNHTKYLHYLVFISLFFTLNHQVIAQTTTSEESTTTQETTPQKKQDLEETQNDHQANSSADATCPHMDKPLNSLNEQELEEVLTCTQKQKAKIAQQVDVIEELIEQKQEEKTGIPVKKKNRCPYASTPLKNLKAPQLEEVYEYTQTHTMDNAFMISLLERLITLSDNHASVKIYKLQLADTHYAAHHIEKAAICYEDFAVMYPGSKECEYVLYKAIACMFELSLEPDRDQTNTKKTIALVKEFLKRAVNKDLILEAHQIMQQCYQRLYDHEVYVFNFYMKRKNFTAAQLRLDYIAKTFTETIASLDAKVQALKQQLDLAKNPIKKPKQYFAHRFLA